MEFKHRTSSQRDPQDDRSGLIPWQFLRLHEVSLQGLGEDFRLLRILRSVRDHIKGLGGGRRREVALPKEDYGAEQESGGLKGPFALGVLEEAEAARITVVAANQQDSGSTHGMGLLAEAQKTRLPPGEAHGSRDNPGQLFNEAAYPLGGFPRGSYEDHVARRLSARSRRERRILRASVAGTYAPPVKVYPHLRQLHMPVEMR